MGESVSVVRYPETLILVGQMTATGHHRTCRAPDLEWQANEQKLVDASARQILEVHPLQNVDSALGDKVGMYCLRIALHSGRGYMDC